MRDHPNYGIIKIGQHTENCPNEDWLRERLYISKS